ncbi:MAG: hypothetical protein ABI430_01270 [Candidatus Taylorbacteria bacterium]
MANIYLREAAQKLRREGLSIQDIATEIKVSKSTIGYWCRDIVLSKQQLLYIQEKQKKAGMKAILKFLEKKRAERLKKVEQLTTQGKKEIGQLTKKEFFFIGLALYWGEGYKRGNDEVGFTNSNPFMIKLIIKWFQTFYEVAIQDFILRISINNIHSKRVAEVMHYWSDLIKIPTAQFTKPSLIKTQSKKRYSNENEHFGTLRVKVRRGADIHCKILGSLSGLESLFE